MSSDSFCHVLTVWTWGSKKMVLNFHQPKQIVFIVLIKEGVLQNETYFKVVDDGKFLIHTSNIWICII